MRVPQVYLDNKKEQATIEGALSEAIPVNIHYHNLIIALSGMIRRECVKMFESENGISESDFKNQVLNICQSSGLLYTDSSIANMINDTTQKSFVCQVGDRIFIKDGAGVKEVKEVIE